MVTEFPTTLFDTVTKVDWKILRNTDWSSQFQGVMGNDRITHGDNNFLDSIQ